MIIRTTQVTGEKITLRRFQIVEKGEGQEFGTYSHMGGRISSVVLLDGADEEAARTSLCTLQLLHHNTFHVKKFPAGCLGTHEKGSSNELRRLARKPDNIKEKMVEGRLNKFLADISLVDQPFVKGDGKETVAKFVESKGGKVVSFVRYEVGEGMEKANIDFAAEVAAQIG